MIAPTSDDPLLRHALDYVRRCWSVLPLWWPTASGGCACGLPDCDTTGAHPVRRLVPNGLRDRSDQEETVRGWWRTVPRANVAIGTGARGPVVLDVRGPVGELTLRGLVAFHGSFHAWWVRPGLGGWHAYFTHPGTATPSSADRVGEGIDVLGDGAYVVAPPSLHASLRRYRWLTREPGAADPPAMPDWLLALAVSGDGEAACPEPLRLRSGDVAAFAAATLERERRAVARTPRSERGRRLHRAAFRLGQLVGAGLMDEPTVISALVDVVVATWPADRLIRSTVRSGVRAGMLQPRRILLHRPRGEGRTC